jgi:hypothetical protein
LCGVHPTQASKQEVSCRTGAGCFICQR